MQKGRPHVSEIYGIHEVSGKTDTFLSSQKETCISAMVRHK